MRFSPLHNNFCVRDFFVYKIRKTYGYCNDHEPRTDKPGNDSVSNDKNEKFTADMHIYLVDKNGKAITGDIIIFL